MKTLAVIGSGQMGIGIAQVSVAAGLEVYLIDKSKKALENAEMSLTASFEKLQSKGKLSKEQVQKALSLLNFSEELPSNPIDLVIEAIVENQDLKAKLFEEVERKVQPKTLLATNTSSISITELAKSLQKPDRFIGIHFMNPVPLIPLVEIIRGDQTSESVLAQAQAYCNLLEKTAVFVQDHPGFIVNRLLIPMINEAFFILEEKGATAEDIDTAMKLGANHPLGPLSLADMIGLDTCLAIMELFHRELEDDKYRPSPLLKKYVKDGMLGRKSGQGVFQYESKSA